MHYHLPEAGQSWARIFGLMESAKNQYQIEDYSVGQTTLEQVRVSLTDVGSIIIAVCGLTSPLFFSFQVFLNFAKSQVGEDVNGRGRTQVSIINSLIHSFCSGSCSKLCSWECTVDFD